LHRRGQYLRESESKFMATVSEIKEYLACWFQLGKGVLFPKTQQTCRPEPVFNLGGYSTAFESLWQRIQTSPEDCYLQGTNQTVRDLLSGEWEIIVCARCTLPIPTSVTHIPCSLCPCNDLDLWPNLELPLPRPPVNEVRHLQRLKEHLARLAQQEENSDLKADNL